jgi:hypothetical protein
MSNLPTRIHFECSEHSYIKGKSKKAGFKR